MSVRALVAAALLGSAAPLAAQTAPPPEGFRHGYGGQHGGRLFISPMGEPFRDSPDNAAAWFAQADADHDGRLTLTEFRADALRFFATLDSDHDHEIGPEEIDHYEQVIAPETASGGGFGDGAPGSGGKQGGGHRGGGRGGMGGGHGGGMGGGGRGGGMGGGASPDSESGSDHQNASAFDPTKQGAARFSYLALPESVIAADTDFNRGVSEQEFLAAASRRFALLDPNHDGVITFDELPKLGSGGIGPPRGRHGPMPLEPGE